MRVRFIFMGKTRMSFVEEGLREYFGRLNHYIRTEIVIIPDLKQTKNMPEAEQIRLEGLRILEKIEKKDLNILLDEKGRRFTSIQLAGFFEKKMNEGRDICLIIGGAYGFSDQVKDECRTTISLSDLTFSHQMVRMILVEQVYRAFTIIRGEPYHHG